MGGHGEGARKPINLNRRGLAEQELVTIEGNVRRRRGAAEAVKNWQLDTAAQPACSPSYSGGVRGRLKGRVMWGRRRGRGRRKVCWPE